MYKRYAIAAAFLGIAACATLKPEAPKSAANAGGPVAGNIQIVTEEQLDVVDVPEVPISANMPPPAKETCRRESEIGSRRMKRICRTQSEANQTQTEAKDTLDELQRIQDLQNIPIRH